MGQLNCAAFLAGIIAGVLDSAKFVIDLLCSFFSYFPKDAKVTAHLVHQPEGDRTVFLIKFSPEVMAREKRLGAT